MAIAHDAESNVAAGTGDLSWTHTPVGTPRGALVLVVQNTNPTDQIDGCTYGGVAMVELPGSPVLHANGSEDGALYGYFLPDPPAGPQTVFVDTTSTGSSRRAVCFTQTAGSGRSIRVEDTTVLDQASGANPALVMTTGASVETLTYAALHSGQDAVTSIAAGSGMTEVLEHDFGSQTASWIRSTATDPGSNFTAGWTVASEEAGAFGVALKEYIPIIVDGLEFEVLSTANGSGSLAVTAAGCTSDDLLLAFCDSDNGDPAPSAPGGWSLPASAVGDATWDRLRVFARSGADGTYNFSLVGGSDGSVILVRVRGDGPVQVDDAAGGDNTLVAPSVDSLGGVLLNYWLHWGNAASTIAAPGTPTTWLDNHQSGAWGRRLGVADAVSAGATGTRTATTAGSNTRAALSIAVSVAGSDPDPVDGDLEQASETDSAGDLSPEPGPVDVPLDGASETDSAGEMTGEVETASGTLDQAGETDTAGEMVPEPGPVDVDLDAAAETDTAGALTPDPGGVDVDLDGAGETDTAGTLTPEPGTASVELGQASETDTAGEFTAEVEVDETAPNTSITSGPASDARPYADFLLEADEAGCAFEVRVDGGAWEPAGGTPQDAAGVTTCAHRVDSVGIGPHTLQARATDAAANTDATPAEWAWTTQRPAIHVRELPPIRLAHRITLPNGRPVRWGSDEPDPSKRPTSVEFGSEMPGGHAQASARLPRVAGLDYGDQRGFADWLIYGAGGETAWEGRLQRSGRDDDQAVYANPQGVGWQAHLEDDKTVSFLGIDRDLGRWQGMSAQRRHDVTAPDGAPAFGPTGDGQATSDTSTGLPVMRLEVSGAMQGSTGARTDSWYDAGPGNRIAGLICGSAAGRNHNNANWDLSAFAGDTDTATGATAALFTATANTAVATQYRAFAAAKRWAWLRFAWLGGASASDLERWRDVKQLAVVGDHGLPLYGPTGQEGLLGSDIVSHAVSKWAPLLNFTTGLQGTILPTAWPISHFAPIDPTTVAELVRQATVFELPDWAVWDRRTFYLHQPGARGRRWRLRAGPTKLREAGHDMGRVWDRISVSFRDVDGTTRIVGPPGSRADVEDPALRDLDPLNPAVMAGIPRHDLLVMRGPSTAANAIETGRLWLEHSKALDQSGQATVTGYATDDRGIVHPYWAIRAGDYASWVDARDSSWRKIVSVRHSEQSCTAALDIDAPPDAIEALLARLDVDLIRLGLS